MNKKIYFESKFILITDAEVQPSQNQLIVEAEKETELFINESLKKFIEQNDQINLIFICKNVIEVFEKLKTQFVSIEAAGGLIKKNNHYLFIHRLQKWDLPKGKLDLGESKEHAAIRECEEECGVKELTIIKELPSTYHIYNYKGKQALKTTYWFLMETSYSGELSPQLNENIDKAQWMSTNEITNVVLIKTYPSVFDLINVSIGI